MKRFLFTFVFLFLALGVFTPLLAQNKSLLSPEEVLWLESRNNTIVVYPEKNDPPFSYTSASGNIQGLSVDYMELVADKVGAKIQYLNPQARNQVLAEFAQGKGDVIPGLTQTNEKELTFLFTDSYVTVPTVIVVRKDFEKKALTLNDFNGKRVSVVAGSALLEYIRENYPRVVIEDVTDDEVSLQQIVLGEVDAGVMDVASLSYYLSKQVLNSVKIVGSTGYEYKPAFAVSKDKAILQSILEKGFTQITTNERTILNEKWIVVPGEEKPVDTFIARVEKVINIELLYVVFGLGVLLVIVFLLRFHRTGPSVITYAKTEGVNELKDEVEELEDANKKLALELKEIKEQDKKIAEKLESITTNQAYVLGNQVAKKE